MWNGTLPRGEYVPWSFSLVKDADKSNLIHAYPPWEYAWMLPMTFLRRDVAERVFWALSWAGLIFLCVSAYVLGYLRSSGIVWIGFASTCSVLVLNGAIDTCLVYQNYGLLIAAAVLAAVLCHERGHDLWAGIFWAFTLVKPQLGALFFVPLVIRGKWRTIIISCGITLFGTLVVAALCGRSPIDMILSISKYSQGQFSETGLVPMPLYLLLVSRVGHSVLMLGSAVIGLLLCVAVNLILRPEEDAFEWTLPSVFLSTLWTASRTHDQVIYAVMFIALTLSACRRRELSTMMLDLSLIVFTLMRGVDDTLPLPVKVFQVIALIILFYRAFQIRQARGGRL